MTNPNWNEFEQRRQAAPAASTAASDAYAELCALVFSSGAGHDMLIAMRARTIEARTPPNAPDAMLREIEAQRRFVADIEIARVRGLELLAAKKPNPA